MSYKLHISNDCPACGRVLEYIMENDIQHELVNVSDPDKNPVEGVLIYPALFTNNNLQAYGDDIITWLRKAVNEEAA